MGDKYLIKNGAVVEGFSMGSTLFDIQGTQGQLFSVTDSLYGDIFSVSDITGMPILNVNSNGTVSIDGTLSVNGTGVFNNDLSVNGELTVGTSVLSYIRMRDDNSPSGYKYIHANGNNIGFLNSDGNWSARWDNAGNQTNIGSVNAPLFNGSGSGLTGVAKSVSIGQSNIDAWLGDGFFEFDPIPTGTPPLQSPNIRVLSIGASARNTQMAFDYNTDRSFFRRRLESTWYPWVEYYHTGNLTPSNYLPLAGGTMTGQLIHIANTTAWSGGRFRKNQTTEYTQAGLIVENFDGGVTGIGFHISSVLGKMLYMDTSGTLKWEGSDIYHTGNLTPSNYATHRGEGTNYIDYSYGLYDAYRGGWRTSNDLYVAYAYNSNQAAIVRQDPTGSNVADLVYSQMADNDYFRLRVGGTATNAGYVEFATADDGTEPIYFRQYSGTFTSITRTLTLLDGNGNSSFPGHIYGSGNLYLNSNYGNTVVGAYDASKIQGVYAMGQAYMLPVDGTSSGNLYGMAWSHPNAGGQASNLSSHGLLLMQNGVTMAALSTNIWIQGTFYGNGAGLTGTASSLSVNYANSAGFTNVYAGNECVIHNGIGGGNVAYINYRGSNGDGILHYIMGNGLGNGGTVPIIASNFIGSGAGLTGTASSLSVNYATSAGSAPNQSASAYSNDWVASFQNTPPHSTSFREMSTGGPSGTWWFVHNFRHSNAGNYWGAQFAIGWEDNANRMSMRNWSGGSYTGWVDFITSSNIGSQNVQFANVASNCTNASYVNHFQSRTDAAWYNVVWASGSPSPMYSCDAIQIQSSTGIIKANNFTLGSDIRIKTEIKPISLEYIDIQYKEFELLSNLGEKRYGVIAQELLLLGHPELVSGSDTEMYSVKYIDLFVKEIAYLKNEVKLLKDEIQKIKSV